MTDKEALKLALKAQQIIASLCADKVIDSKEENILRAAINQALAALVQEPVAWMDADGDVYKSEPQKNWCPPHIPLYTTLPAAPVQEPSQWRDMVVVSLVREGINKHKARELAGHFAAPPAAQPATVQEWMKPHPKCDEACIFQCTKGFTRFPECATTPPAIQPAPVPVKTFHGGKPWPLHPAPVQEPVAVVKVLPLGDGHKPMHWADWTDADNPPPEGTLLHTAAQRQWVGLTDEDLANCSGHEVRWALYWEKLLKEKNT